MFSKETWKKIIKTKYVILNMKKDCRFAIIIFIPKTKLFVTVQIVRSK